MAPPPPRRAGRRLARVLAAVVVLCGLIAMTAYDALHRPGPLPAAATVVVPKGASLGEIAALLHHAHVIASPLLFRLGIRTSGRATSLRAGEYAFAGGSSLAEVLTTLRQGRTVIRKLTVPEGLTSHQIVALLTATPALSGTIATVPAEGTLMPSTYFYSYGDDREAMLHRMAAAMKETVHALWAQRAPDLPLKAPEDAVILASIVEKETALPEERPRVAAVFLNRLRLGMRLRADPTVAYGLTHGGAGEAPRPLTTADLESPSPYNTYQVAGLPPGPIDNPGHASLLAVLHPAATDDLYFVADGSGGHAFARTLAEHNENVRRWRKLERANAR